MHILQKVSPILFLSDYRVQQIAKHSFNREVVNFSATQFSFGAATDTDHTLSDISAEKRERESETKDKMKEEDLFYKVWSVHPDGMRMWNSSR